MNEFISFVCEGLLLCLIVYQLAKRVLSADTSKIWSPISVISITYLYYCSMPYWLGSIEAFEVDESLHNGYLFHIASLISYVTILISYNKTSTGKSFDKWNGLFDSQNAGKAGILLAVFAIVCYSSVRGFHFSIGQADEIIELTTGGIIYYLITMLDMLPFALGLLYIGCKNKDKKWIRLISIILLFYILMLFIFAGARWRIVFGTMVLLTTINSYPYSKRPNYLLIAALAVVLFLGFSIMDHSRVRGQGISIEAAKSLQFDDIKDGAQENYTVYSFSLLAMDYMHTTGERIYFDPHFCALCMPIPRAIFPNKPGAGYIGAVESAVGYSGGSAWLHFVEHFYAFGWLGLILFSWLLGWLARRFWDNYASNPHSIGAIVALGAFSGFCYVTVSRGYLAATLTTFLIAICLPFWMVKLFSRIKKN